MIVKGNIYKYNEERDNKYFNNNRRYLKIKFTIFEFKYIETNNNDNNDNNNNDNNNKDNNKENIIEKNILDYQKTTLEFISKNNFSMKRKNKRIENTESEINLKKIKKTNPLKLKSKNQDYSPLENTEQMNIPNPSFNSQLMKDLQKKCFSVDNKEQYHESNKAETKNRNLYIYDFNGHLPFITSFVEFEFVLKYNVKLHIFIISKLKKIRFIKKTMKKEKNTISKRLFIRLLNIRIDYKNKEKLQSNMKNIKQTVIYNIDTILYNNLLEDNIKKKIFEITLDNFELKMKYYISPLFHMNILERFQFTKDLYNQLFELLLYNKEKLPLFCFSNIIPLKWYLENINILNNKNDLKQIQIHENTKSNIDLEYHFLMRLPELPNFDYISEFKSVNKLEKKMYIPLEKRFSLLKSILLYKRLYLFFTSLQSNFHQSIVFFDLEFLVINMDIIEISNFSKQWEPRTSNNLSSAMKKARLIRYIIQNIINWNILTKGNKKSEIKRIFSNNNCFDINFFVNNSIDLLTKKKQELYNQMNKKESKFMKKYFNSIRVQDKILSGYNIKFFTFQFFFNMYEQFFRLLNEKIPNCLTIFQKSLQNENHLSEHFQEFNSNNQEKECKKPNRNNEIIQRLNNNSCLNLNIPPDLLCENCHYHKIQYINELKKQKLYCQYKEIDKTMFYESICFIVSNQYYLNPLKQLIQLERKNIESNIEKKKSILKVNQNELFDNAKVMIITYNETRKKQVLSKLSFQNIYSIYECIKDWDQLNSTHNYKYFQSKKPNTQINSNNNNNNDNDINNSNNADNNSNYSYNNTYIKKEVYDKLQKCSILLLYCTHEWNMIHLIHLLTVFIGLRYKKKNIDSITKDKQSEELFSILLHGELGESTTPNSNILTFPFNLLIRNSKYKVYFIPFCNSQIINMPQKKIIIKQNSLSLENKEEIDSINTLKPQKNENIMNYDIKLNIEKHLNSRTLCKSLCFLKNQNNTRNSQFISYYKKTDKLYKELYTMNGILDYLNGNNNNCLMKSDFMKILRNPYISSKEIQSIIENYQYNSSNNNTSSFLKYFNNENDFYSEWKKILKNTLIQNNKIKNPFRSIQVYCDTEETKDNLYSILNDILIDIIKEINNVNINPIFEDENNNDNNNNNNYNNNDNNCNYSNNSKHQINNKKKECLQFVKFYSYSYSKILQTQKNHTNQLYKNTILPGDKVILPETNDIGIVKEILNLNLEYITINDTLPIVCKERTQNFKSPFIHKSSKQYQEYLDCFYLPRKIKKYNEEKNTLGIYYLQIENDPIKDHSICCSIENSNLKSFRRFPNHYPSIKKANIIEYDQAIIDQNEYVFIFIGNKEYIQRQLFYKILNYTEKTLYIFSKFTSFKFIKDI